MVFFFTQDNAVSYRAVFRYYLNSIGYSFSALIVLFYVAYEGFTIGASLWLARYCYSGFSTAATSGGAGGPTTQQRWSRA